MNDNKYQDFLEKLQNADESERDWLVMEFSLQNLSETLRQAVVAAAIPHWFDHDFLNAILRFPLKDSDFQTLINLSFVEKFPERGFNIHERSRNLLLNHLWTTNKARYKKLSKHAAAYCKKQDQKEAIWRIETLYHGVLADSPSAKKSVIQQGLDWHDSFQYNKLESLTQIILDEVGSKFVTGEVKAWAAFFKARVDMLYSRNISAQNFLQQAIKHKTDNFLVASCIDTLGDLHYYSSEYKQARKYYQLALVHYQKIKGCLLNQANCIQSFGRVHNSLAEYGQAQDCYQKALSIFQKNKDSLGEANCIQYLGEVYQHLAKYEQAQERYQKALLIYQEIKDRLGEANCLRHLGSLQGVQSQIECAVTTLQQASELYQKIGFRESQASCFGDIAIIYLNKKEFTLALNAFNQAIEIFSSPVWYLNRAELYMKMDDYDKAEADINRAMGEKHLAYVLLHKAALALWQQQPAQAIELSLQAIVQRPADGIFRTVFALALFTDEQIELAYTEMQQALTTIYQPYDFDELLENLDKLIRIYGERPEFETMRELITSSPRYKTSREIKLANMI